MDNDGNELDGECSRPQKHAKSPELAREFLLDAATVIFKEQVCSAMIKVISLRFIILNLFLINPSLIQLCDRSFRLMYTMCVQHLGMFLY